MSEAPEGVRFEPASRALLSDQVANMILETITSGSMAPGDKLPSERELGEQFEVSRTVVREAVRSLAAKGIIEVRSGSGLRVAHIDASNVTESMSLFVRGMRLDYDKIHEVRALIEIEVAALAAERADEEDLRRIADNLDRTEASLDDEQRVADLDVQFHREVAIATHNELHVLMLDSIEDVLLEVRRSTLSRAGRPGEALVAHRRIADAISERSPDAARDAMREHLEDSYRLWKIISAESAVEAAR
jgi:GntR family transcriptional repressor for pyruvate dehydrogenase complex